MSYSYHPKDSIIKDKNRHLGKINENLDDSIVSMAFEVRQGRNGIAMSGNTKIDTYSTDFKNLYAELVHTYGKGESHHDGQEQWLQLLNSEN